MGAARAVARGELVGPEAWTGRIVSVHQRALNILRTDGYLVSLVTRESDMTAMSVLVPSLPAGGRALEGFPIRGDGLGIRARAEPLVDLTGSPPWSGRVRHAPRIGPRALGEAARSLLDLRRPYCLVALIVAGAPRTPVARTVAAGIERWRGGRGDGGDLAALVGLGPGLTPAADDFLTGMLLADTLAAGGALGSVVRRFHARALRAIGGALGSTTAAGRTLLEQALGRRFPSYLLAFAEAPSAIAVAAASSHGATSGTDAVAGFLWMASAPRPCPAERARVHYPACSGG